jgi:hypothetical protein
MTAFANTRKLLAQLEKKGYDEVAIRSARAELERADEQAVHPLPDPSSSRITTDEAVRALASLFGVMERTLIAMRKKTAGNLMISNDVADAFIEAQDVLKRSGYEPIARRAVEPLTLTPVQEG